MEITGTLIQVLTPQTGTGKNGQWKKQDFIIETTDMYPKKVCLAAWGDKIDISKFNVGQTVKASFDVESREYNGKWYTDVKAFNLQLVNKNDKSDGGESGIKVIDVNDDDLPF
jgi:mRNA-degrading endonuclease HigB of HigAB toxin-antitoxin module